MFKMGCSMARKILSPGAGSSSNGHDSQAFSSGASVAVAAPDKKSKVMNLAPAEGNNGGGGGKPKSGDELDDFSKLEEDPRLPLNVRQIFKITKSWKAIARTMSKTGTAMFLNLFEQNRDLFYLFDRFQHLKGRELHESMELREHAATVMSTLDQSINSLSNYDNFISYLHSIGQLHRRVPGFKREYFWRIEQPFMKAIKQTLDERCNETIEQIYKIAIKLIIETIAEGYGQDEVEIESGDDAGREGPRGGGTGAPGGHANKESGERADSQREGDNGGGAGGENKPVGAVFVGGNQRTASCGAREAQEAGRRRAAAQTESAFQERRQRRGAAMRPGSGSPSGRGRNSTERTRADASKASSTNRSGDRPDETLNADAHNGTNSHRRTTISGPSDELINVTPTACPWRPSTCSRPRRVDAGAGANAAISGLASCGAPSASPVGRQELDVACAPPCHRCRRLAANELDRSVVTRTTTTTTLAADFNEQQRLRCASLNENIVLRKRHRLKTTPLANGPSASCECNEHASGDCDSGQCERHPAGSRPDELAAPEIATPTRLHRESDDDQAEGCRRTTAAGLRREGDNTTNDPSVRAREDRKITKLVVGSVDEADTSRRTFGSADDAIAILHKSVLRIVNAGDNDHDDHDDQRRQLGRVLLLINRLSQSLVASKYEPAGERPNGGHSLRVELASAVC